MSKSVADHPQWRGQRDTRSRVFSALVVFSLLLHVPFTPLGALLGLLSLLGPTDPETPDLGEIQGIPVTLLSAEELAALGLEPPAEPPPPAAPPSEPAPGEPALADEDNVEELFEEPKKPEPEKTKPEKKPPPIEPVDGGAAETPTPAEKPPEEPKPAEPLAAAEAPDAGAVSAQKAPEVGTPSDPGALVGSAASVTDPNANVKLLLLNDRIAAHPVGPRVGALLRRVPQWRSFFGPSGLDPVKDIRRVYVAGPQFRDSAEVAAVLEYRVPERTMRAAIDAIVQREPKGEWLGTKPPAARAKADRAERVFVLARPGVVAMVPPHLTKDTIAKASSLQFPPMPGEAAVTAFIKTPWRVLIGFQSPVTIPKSISLLVIQVLPEAAGGVTVQITATDESPDAAKEHASVLERAINLATQRDMGALGSLLFGSEKLQLLEPVTLTAKGNSIVGSAKATPRQVDRMLNFVESFLDAIENRERIQDRKRIPTPDVPREDLPGRAPRPARSVTTELPSPPTAAPAPAPVPAPTEEPPRGAPAPTGPSP